MKREKLEFIILGAVTIFLAIDGLTGRWLPNIIEHIGAGFLVSYWSFFFINFLSKNRFIILKEVLSSLLYLTAIFLWERQFNFDVLFGIIGITIFLFYIKTREMKHALD